MNHSTRAPRTAAVVAGITLQLFVSASAHAEKVELRVHADEPGDTISRYLYGHFAEHLGRGIYGGIWVGEDSDIPNTRGLRNDVVAALKALSIPVIRWPGGCFADEYHWRDGIGPRDERPVRINKNWGWVAESNAFGTHEFFDLLELIGSEAYIAGNAGSGSPREMAEWVEYMTEPGDTTLARLRRANGRDEPWEVPFFGVGNESWGCGGSMSAPYYADLYKRFATFIKAPEGKRPKLVASGGYDGDVYWTEVLSKERLTGVSWSYPMDGISHHYYTLPSGDFAAKGNATGFPVAEWVSTLANTLRVDDFLAANAEVLDKNDPDGTIGIYLDEWGTWYDPREGDEPGFLYQQNTIRDALVAALNFNIFHRHTARLHMANIAQTVNVLQAMILTDGEEMILTPTYHAFEMYVPFQDATFVPVSDDGIPEYSVGDATVPQLSATAALDADGSLVLALVNLHAEQSIEVSVDIDGFDAASGAGRLLTGEAIDAHNTFEQPGRVAPAPVSAQVVRGSVRVSLPARSVSVYTFPAE